MKLLNLKPGHSAIVRAINIDDPGLSRRLEAMGFTKGQEVKLLRKAWWNGPLHVRVGITTEVAMRRHEAQGIELELSVH
ncbi:MAG TPA: ferrous iron transport protein A [Cyanothece sp. UBA12306]|nr:ferrous iron transport protein A [Cyanothece sp. UBA12306]